MKRRNLYYVEIYDKADASSYILQTCFVKTLGTAVKTANQIDYLDDKYNIAIVTVDAKMDGDDILEYEIIKSEDLKDVKNRIGLD